MRRLAPGLLCLFLSAAGAARALAAPEDTPLVRQGLPAAARLDCPSPCVHLDVEAYWRIGPSDGFLQTPRGGEPGTSSSRRPTFDELGVGTTTELGIAAATTWRRHEIAFEWDLMLLGGESVLARDLVSQGDAFPAGTTFESDSWIGTYRLGYRYRIDVPLWGCERLVVKPGVGVTALDVNYQTTGSNFRDTDRSYMHGGPHLDLGVAWRPGGSSRFVVEARASQTLAFVLGDSNRMDILEGRLRLKYEPNPCWNLIFETGWRRTDWRDNQDMPNHIHVEYGPWFGFGLGVHF
jgi:hypothetical protein